MSKGSGKCGNRMNIFIENLSDNFNDYNIINEYLNLDTFIKENNINNITDFLSNQLFKEELIRYLENQNYNNIVSKTIALEFIKGLNNNRLLNDKDFNFKEVLLNQDFDSSLKNNFAKPRAIFLNNSLFKDNLSYIQFLEHKKINKKYIANVSLYLPSNLKKIPGNLDKTKFLSELNLEIMNVYKTPLIIQEGKHITNEDFERYLKTYLPNYYKYILENNCLDEIRSQYFFINETKMKYIFENGNNDFQFHAEVTKNKEKEFLDILTKNLKDKLNINELDIVDNHLDIVDYQSVHDISGGKKYQTKFIYDSQEVVLEYIPYHLDKKIQKTTYNYNAAVKISDIVLSQLEDKIDNQLKIIGKTHPGIIDANKPIFKLSINNENLFINNKLFITESGKFNKLSYNHKEINLLLDNINKLQDGEYNYKDLVDNSVLESSYATYIKNVIKDGNKTILNSNDDKEILIENIKEDNLKIYGFSQLKDKHYFFNNQELDSKITELKNNIKILNNFKSNKELIINFDSRYQSNLNELKTKSDNKIFNSLLKEYPILKLLNNNKYLEGNELQKRLFNIITKELDFKLEKTKIKRNVNIDHNPVFSEKGHLYIKNLNSKESFNLIKDLNLVDNNIKNIPYKTFYNDSSHFRKITPKLDNYIKGVKQIRLPKNNMIIHGLTGVDNQKTAIERLRQIEKTGGLKSIAQRRKEQIKVRSMSPKGDIASGIDSSVPCKIANSTGYGSYVFFGIKEEVLERRDIFFSYTDFGAGKNRYPEYNKYAKAIGQGHIYNPPAHQSRLKHLKTGLGVYNEIWFKDQIMLDELNCLFVDNKIFQEVFSLEQEWKDKGLVDNNFKILSFKDEYELDNLLHQRSAS